MEGKGRCDGTWHANLAMAKLAGLGLQVFTAEIDQMRNKIISRSIEYRSLSNRNRH